LKTVAADSKKMTGMKAHFDVGVAKLDVAKEKKAALAKAPADQRDALKQEMSDAATQAVTELEASKPQRRKKDTNLPLILSRLEMRMKRQAGRMMRLRRINRRSSLSRRQIFI